MLLFKILCTIAIMAVSASAALTSGYANTCNTCKIQDDPVEGREPMLFCVCGDGHGSYPPASLNMNTCFANDGGFLVYRRDGNFAYTCRNYRFDHDSVMIITCANGKGSWDDNHVDLNDYIGNDQGTLYC
ncbi:hypothetical protein AMS68_004236 [Peltaster fructicola]|uniref:Cyanovirin-N domain-containing protein n=1 Tax=Peltaster fructicola TaxID=286661 RepID=A0A6H0XVS4_9PEZI|nr:hypothetical protein AMS68_004236 [Peltaster fructicola]